MKNLTPHIALASCLAILTAAASASAESLPSCEQIIQTYVEDQAATKDAPADLDVSDFSSLLNSGAYLTSCGVPHSTGVAICAAVQNGEVKGITVLATPSDAKLEACVVEAVVGLAFPSHPRMDVVRTKFAPQTEETSASSESRGTSSAGDGSAEKPPPVPPKSGCGCSTAPGSTRLAWIPLAIAIVVRRGLRRRRG
jgi:hypothetical protein